MRRTVRDRDCDRAVVSIASGFVFLRLHNVRFRDDVSASVAHMYTPGRARKLAQALNDAADTLVRERRRRRKTVR